MSSAGSENKDSLFPIGSGGASIIAVILMLTLLTTMGMVVSSLFSTSVEESTGTVTSMRAFYAAEAGAEAAFGHLNADNIYCSRCYLR